MKYFKRIKLGFHFVFAIAFTIIFFQKIILQTFAYNYSVWWLLDFLIVMIFLAYNIGEIIEHIEAVYLKGQYLSSGKFTINKEVEE